MRRSFALSAFSIVIILGGGFGVARAAEGSLPGQILYPVKINVNEPFIGSLNRSDTARANWERERAGRRIAEAETLAEEGKLGTSETAIIEQHLSDNRKTFEEIEGRAVSDDEFFPEQIKGETNKINVRVEHSKDKTLVHIEERLGSGSDEIKENINEFVNQEESYESFSGYTEKGAKIKKEKKIENKSESKVQTDKQSSGEQKIERKSDEKISLSEKNISSDKQTSEQNSNQRN